MNDIYTESNYANNIWLKTCSCKTIQIIKKYIFTVKQYMVLPILFSLTNNTVDWVVLLAQCSSVICTGTHSSRAATHEDSILKLDKLYLLVQRANDDSQHVVIAVEKKSTSYYGVEIPPIISEEFVMLKRNLLCFFKVS